MNIEHDKLYSVKELAGILRCSQANAYALVNSGQIASIRIGAGKSLRRIQGGDIAAFLEARKSGGPEPRSKIKHLSRWVS